MVRSGVALVGLLAASLAELASAAALEIRGPADGPKAEVLRRVAEAATCVLRLPQFRRELAVRRSFRETEHDGLQVLDSFGRPGTCRLSTYRRGGMFGHLMYWDRVDAMHEAGSSLVKFNLNTFRATDLAFLVGTALHECAHLLGYRHAQNDRFRYPEIEQTVPYQVGFIGQRHAPACL